MGAQEVNDVRGCSANDCGDPPKIGVRLESLIAHARGGSTDALGELLARCQRYLLLVANQSLDSDLRPKGGASDLVQDTFLEAHQDFSHFEGATEPELLAWLTKILNNRVSNHVRHFRGTLKRNVDREFSLEAGWRLDTESFAQAGAAPHQGVIARDEAGQLRAAVNRLPESMRQVLFLRTWERRSFADVAARLGSTPEAVRKVWSRAVRRLQIELRNDS
jgi:RNA polymerase sigma-70 factor (ECF subfamily)